MGVPAITIDLDEDQIDDLKPILKRVNDAARAGTPGMALAQVFFGAHEMKVFFATKEQAEEIQRIMGSPVGLVGRSNGC
jgi:hypothetical protein